MKTQSQRVFPCGEGMRTFLSDFITYTGAPEQFLFLSPHSKFINLERFSARHWRKILKTLNIADRGIYQCRHTYITFCIDSGMDAKDVSKLVRNSPGMIYKHYAGPSRLLSLLAFGKFPRKLLALFFMVEKWR